jgi:hypothetical protein
MAKWPRTRRPCARATGFGASVARTRVFDRTCTLDRMWQIRCRHDDDEYA